MNDSNYLLKVLGLSAIPRLFTSVITLISFPIMLRAVGTSEYGLIVYVGATISILESFVDFGVSAAAGKSIADVRAQKPHLLRKELTRWINLQSKLAFLGLIPLIGVSFLIFSMNAKIKVDSWLLLISVFTVWLTISVNFARACIRSYLAFRTLAVLDTLESTVRSSGLLIVAWFFPSAIGLAFAGLITAITMGIIFCWSLMRVSDIYSVPMVTEDYNRDNALEVNSLRLMVKESFSFLGLRLSTRAFQAVPLVVFGMFGTELVGIISAFSKILEIVTLPFMIIGNALAVKAKEVKAKGLSAIITLWDTCLRLIVMAGVLTGAFFIAAGSVANIFMPKSLHGPILFSIMSVLVLIQSTSSFISPLSDYVGGHRMRVIYVSILAILQIPFLWVGMTFYGEIGVTICYIFIQLLMIIGYIIIAKRAFFELDKYVIPSYIYIALGITIGVLVITVFLTSLTLHLELSDQFQNFKIIITLIFYFVMIFFFFLVIKALRNKFITISVFEFRD